MTTRARSRPGRRLTVAELRFDVFPPGDDHWWIRWFDYDGDGGGTTGAAMIRILLSRLPADTDLADPPMLDEVLASLPGEQRDARLQAGWSPVISIGLIVRAGTVVGRLASRVRRFAFGAPAHRQYLEHLWPREPDLVVGRSHSRPPPKPEGRPRPLGAPAEDLMPGLVGREAYPLRVEDGRLLSIRARASGMSHLVLPCPEVFRVMYAPHRALALAFLGGPWSGVTAKRVLDLELTEALEDGDGSSWSVATLGGPGAAYAALTGNLWINRWGRACADRLWKSISPGVGRRGVIAATLPFAWDALGIDVACLELPASEGMAARTFGYAITSMRWPDPPKGPPSRIDWIPGWQPRPRVPEGETEKPGRPVGSTVPEDGAPLEVVQDEDPANGPGVDVIGDGPVWTNAPEVVTVQREPGLPGTRRRILRRQAPHVGAGADGGGADGPALAQPQAIDPFGGGGSACDRFERVVAILDRLVEVGSIHFHGEVTPPRAWAVPRGSRSVWAFPDICAMTAKGGERWYVRDFARTAPGGRDVRRAAMVRSIVADTAILHLIETEPRSSEESFHALLFEQAGDAGLESVVLSLLRAASVSRGVWIKALGSMAASCGDASLERTELVRHVTLSDKPAGGLPDGSLDSAPLLASIRSLLR